MVSYNSKVALISNVLDYAGTFPPAKLDLFSALKEFISFRVTARHSWLLSKMTLPISFLKEIHSRRLFEAGSNGTRLFFTVTGTPLEGTPVETWMGTFLSDLRFLEAFNLGGKSSSSPYQAIGYEFKWPGRLASEQERLVLSQVFDVFARSHDRPCLSFEFPFNAAWSDTIQSWVGLHDKWVRDSLKSHLRCGLKIRMGGHEAAGVKELSQFIETCASSNLQFKATQGLHHAFSGADGIGFVNVFAALNFAFVMGAKEFGAHRIEKCLREQNRQAFNFGPNAMSWDGLELSCASIEDAKSHHQGSFGSCSLREPDEFLDRE